MGQVSPERSFMDEPSVASTATSDNLPFGQVAYVLGGKAVFLTGLGGREDTFKRG